MPTYYARKAGNINATDVWATAPGGTASAVTFAAGDVLVSNSFAIAINVDTNLGGSGQLRNDTFGGATAGGTFTLAAGLTLTANILQNNVSGVANVVNCAFSAPLSASIVGNVTSVNTSGGSRPVNLTGNGTLNFTGNATGDMKSSSLGGAIGNVWGGTINFVGTATGGGGAGGNALENFSAGTINITGNCLGAVGPAVGNASTGTINITGNATGGSASGGSGVNNAAGGVIAITGNATGGVSGPGVTNASSGSVTATRAVGNAFGLGSVGLTAATGIANSGNAGVVEVRELEYGLRGMSPVTGFVRLKRNSLNQAIFNWVDSGAAKILVDATQGEMPAVGNVRLGVSYASGALTGACAVPSPATVATGVPVDNTVGTAALSASDVANAVWAAATRTITGGLVDTATTLTNAPTVPTPSQIASQVRTELSTELSRLDVATSTRAVAADIPTSDISAIKSKTDALPSDPADQSLVEAAIFGLTIPSVVQIREEMDSNSTKLANLDATISSRSTLTTGDLPSVPSAASVASAVRTELTELSNLDASVSSRLASAAYTAPTSAPTAAAVASAVRAELTELSNLDASVSSRLASASYTAPANSDISAIKSKTDNLPASPAAVSDIPTTAQISAAVEGSLLNEGDGQAVLNAIVGAIGNQNLSEVSLVAAIRSDLERVGGKIDSIPTSSAPSASTVAGAVRTELATELGRLDASVSSRLSPSGTLATVTNLTNAPASVTPADIWDYNARTLTSASGPTAIEIRQELDSNSTQLSAIKSKTDALPSDPADQSLLEAAIAGVAAPSAATVASAVRSELSTELTKVSALNTERLANVATTAIVGNLIAQANS